MKSQQVMAVAGLCLTASLAISQSLPGRSGHPPVTGPARFPHTPPQFGDPLYGLTTAQSTSFTVGQAQFEKVDGASDGLGPIFNAQSCNACHTQPLVGGVATAGGASAITRKHALATLTGYSTSCIRPAWNPVCRISFLRIRSSSRIAKRRRFLGRALSRQSRTRPLSLTCTTPQWTE